MNIEMIFISKSHFFRINDEIPEDMQTSVICLGLDDYTGKRLNNDLIMELETNIIEQLKYFESRINPETIEVDVKIKNNGYSCDIIVTGKINMAEINEEIKFKTSFNFETGLSVIEQL